MKQKFNRRLNPRVRIVVWANKTHSWSNDVKYKLSKENLPRVEIAPALPKYLELNGLLQRKLKES